MSNSKEQQLIKQLNIPREKAASLGHETVDILRAGCYVSKDGNTVRINNQIMASVEGTVTYSPETSVPQTVKGKSRIVIKVINDTTLSAACQLISLGYEPAALNFASATTPGGGFLGGARAQEEYLARSSALWSCLYRNEMYDYHSSRLDPFYADYVIYSPGIPIIRNDDGDLLDTPYTCSIITSPAVHASGVRRYLPERIKNINHIMKARIIKVLAVAVKHGHKAIVLGAWGCGAFGNDPNEISILFREALENEFCGAFEHIIFAITDWSDEKRFIKPFERQLTMIGKT